MGADATPRRPDWARIARKTHAKGHRRGRGPNPYLRVREFLRRAAFTAVGIAVSAAALGLAFFRPQHRADGWTLVPRFDFGLWWADLPRHLIWLIPFLLLSASLPALRAFMWGFTAPAPAPSYGARYHAIAVGALVHNTMPARLGLLVTAIFAGRRVHRPVVEMLASLLVAKLLELAALVLPSRPCCR